MSLKRFRGQLSGCLPGCGPGHETYVMTKRVLFQVQAVEMGFFAERLQFDILRQCT